MHTAKFEIECRHPEIVKEAVEVDGKSEAEYTVEDNKLVVGVKSENLKTLMKIVHSVYQKVQLSLDTIDKFGNK